MPNASFTPRDDHFHFEEMGDDRRATETAWFSFHYPERRLGGWLYTLIRPNIGTVAGGAWIWGGREGAPLLSNLVDRDDSFRGYAAGTGTTIDEDARRYYHVPYAMRTAWALPVVLSNAARDLGY